MARSIWRNVVAGLGALTGSLFSVSTAMAQVASPPVWSADSLVRLDPAMLDQVYQQGTVAGLPPGRARGRVIPFPGSSLAPTSSKVARIIWQGKVVNPDGSGIVNRFFGVRAIRGQLYQAESWLDGQPALIIDYSRTSHLYARYRDEIRQIAPGLYLGLMYDRTCPPKLKTYFILETDGCP